MMLRMNDIDFEEKLLLDQHNYQQHLNLPPHRDSYQNEEQYYDIDPIEINTNKQHQLNTSHSYDDNDNRNKVASTVSMSTEEELLDDFELFDGEQPNIVDTETVDTEDSTDVSLSFENTIEEIDNIPEAPMQKRKISMDNETKQKLQDFQKNLKETESLPPKVTPKGKKRKSSTSRKQKDKSEIVRVEMPKKVDILCGQSRVCASHPGNRIFQNVLDDFAYQYDCATSKQEKMKMTKAVVSIIHSSGGRFLKYNDGMWEEISIVAARDKVSHALRTKVASWKRQSKQNIDRYEVLARRRPNAKRSSALRPKRQPPFFNPPNTDTADIVPLPLDAKENNSRVPSAVSSLFYNQQEIFAHLTTVPTQPTAANIPTSKSYENVRDSHYSNRLDHTEHYRRSSSHL